MRRPLPNRARALAAEVQVVRPDTMVSNDFLDLQLHPLMRSWFTRGATTSVQLM